MLGTAVPHRTEPARREVLLGKARAYIEDNLADPGLNPQQIAAAQFISVRQLHALFSQDGTSVAAWIRARRLERCRGDLSDRRHDHLPVGAVAARHGLVDPAHFSRLFKAAYGEPPSEFRRRLRAGDTPA